MPTYSDVINRPCGALVQNARTRRYANVDLAGITVRSALSDADFDIVARLREAGFSRIRRNGPTGGADHYNRWLDDLDQQPGTFSLIGYDILGEPIATMRVQDGRGSRLELERFVPSDSLLSLEQKPAAQFARLSVRKCPEAQNVMFGIFKTAWIWCLRQGIPTIVVATPPWSRGLYDALLFEDLGAEGHFLHSFAGNAPHVTMRLPVAELESLWRPANNPLCEQFFDVTHPALILA